MILDLHVNRSDYNKSKGYCISLGARFERFAIGRRKAHAPGRQPISGGGEEAAGQVQQREYRFSLAQTTLVAATAAARPNLALGMPATGT